MPSSFPISTKNRVIYNHHKCCSFVQLFTHLSHAKFITTELPTVEFVSNKPKSQPNPFEETNLSTYNLQPHSNPTKPSNPSTMHDDHTKYKSCDQMGPPVLICILFHPSLCAVGQLGGPDNPGHTN